MVKALSDATHQIHPPFLPLHRLQVSRRIRRDQEDDGPQAAGHAHGQAPIALDVPRDGVQSAPFLHHQHGRDCSEAFGPGAPWLGENRRVRFIGAEDRRNLTISTVVTRRRHLFTHERADSFDGGIVCILCMVQPQGVANSRELQVVHQVSR